MAFPPAPPPPAPMAAPPPAPVAEAAPARRPGRPRKAALPAALPGAPPPTADEGAEDLWTVVFRLERADGLVIQVPADPGIAEQVIATVVARAKSVIG
jgi:hypothetical protein